MTVAGNWCYISKTAFNELWTHDIRNGQNLIKAPHFIYFCYLMSSIFMSHPSLPSSVQTMRRSLLTQYVVGGRCLLNLTFT